MKLLLFILFFIQAASAAYIPLEDKTPPELHHIIATLQTNELYSVHKKEINILINQMDRAFSSLDNKDVNLIIKSEILKTLLKFPPSSKRAFSSLSPKMSTKLLELSKEFRSSFFSWLTLAIHADMKSLLRSPLFASFKKKIQSSHLKWNPHETQMKKKFSLLLPWYDFLTTNPENRLTEKIYPLLLKCLREIHFKSTRYSSLAPLQAPSKNNQLKYFKKIIPTKKKNALDSLLNSIVEQKEKTDLPRPIDDWVPKEDDYTQKLPNPTYDWLPEPVDDWRL